MQRRTKIIIIFIFLVIATSTSYFYFFSNQNLDVVTLLPDNSPTKQKPKDPGGLVIPNSDSLVFETLKGSNRKERKINLLPEPEKPIEIARSNEVNSKILDSIDEVLNNIEFYETEYINTEEETGFDSLEYVVPNLLLAKTAENTLKDNIYVPGTNLNIIKAFDDSLKIKNYQIVDDEDFGYKVQLSSAYSQADANSEWQRIRQKHKKILSDAHLVVKKVEGKSERIFFLVMAGNYPSLSHAKLICKKLSRRKQNCIVTK